MWKEPVMFHNHLLMGINAWPQPGRRVPWAHVVLERLWALSLHRSNAGAIDSIL